MSRPWVLASASPRRRALLEEIGLTVRVEVALDDAAEEALAQRWQGLAPARLCQRLALAKALAVARRQSEPALVLAADTVLVDGPRVLGKPRDASDAAQTLRGLCGRSHEVLTGMALLEAPNGRVARGLARAEVWLGLDRDQLIEDYVASGQAMGKAGSYGLQDPLFRPLVERVAGDEDTIIGLSRATLRQLAARWDVSL